MATTPASRISSGQSLAAEPDDHDLASRIYDQNSHATPNTLGF